MNNNQKNGNMSSEMKNSEFHKFFVDELKDIYWAENHLAKTLPKMQKAATSKELARAFEKHTQDSLNHIDILKQVFELLDEKAEGKKCAAMEGLIEESRSIIEDTNRDTMTRDAGLILAAQKAEHYEIATYGTLRVFARTMGHDAIAELLSTILENEKMTDVALTEIAESFVNESAVAE